MIWIGLSKTGFYKQVGGIVLNSEVFCDIMNTNSFYDQMDRDSA